MKIFSTLSELLSTELTATIVIRNANGKMTVITNFTTEKGGVCDGLAPFTLKGTPEELDEGFLDAIKAPVETVSGLVSNIEAFQKSAQQAEKNAKASAKPAVKSDAAKKAEDERRRREAEAKARKENFEKARDAAKKANALGNFFTAEALFEFAKTLTDDKKVKAEIDKAVKALAPNKAGFLCNDDEAAANAALEEFKKAMVTPQEEGKPAETAAEAVREAQDAAEDEETSEDESSSDDTDDEISND